jgi:isoquinoline 1-oxidoreductase alpha subunit
MASFTLNDQSVDVPDELGGVSLLWYVREHLGLTGTKYGCGMAQCFACTVLINGAPVASCRTKTSAAFGKAVTTIEGVAKPTGELHPIQEAWLEVGVAQCGYCQPGQILQTLSLLKRNAAPSDEDISAALAANLCRCGTYLDIRKAVKLSAQKLAAAGGKQP